jgi:hypothetical protein
MNETIISIISVLGVVFLLQYMWFGYQIRKLERKYQRKREEIIYDASLELKNFLEGVKREQ